jgi:hypothetical protein
MTLPMDDKYSSPLLQSGTQLKIIASTIAVGARVGTSKCEVSLTLHPQLSKPDFSIDLGYLPLCAGRKRHSYEDARLNTKSQGQAISLSVNHLFVRSIASLSVCARFVFAPAFRSF